MKERGEPHSDIHVQKPRGQQELDVERMARRPVWTEPGAQGRKGDEVPVGAWYA